MALVQGFNLVTASTGGLVVLLVLFVWFMLGLFSVAAVQNVVNPVYILSALKYMFLMKWGLIWLRRHLARIQLV